MKRSITVTPKKKRGRPATGRDPHVTARMPQSIIDQIERWALSNDASRSEAIRRLVELGLKAKRRDRQE
jgi:Arc/MetJ-type ribon-helix-helix transcriptional regulator